MALACDINLEKAMTLYHPYLFTIVGSKRAVISDMWGIITKLHGGYVIHRLKFTFQ